MEKEPPSVEQPSLQAREQELRRRLDIPTDAEHVLILAESSHWDPNWLYTSQEYFARYVRRNLDRAIAELQREPRRIYSVECIFFLRKYWEQCPERREAVQELVNAGRLRLTSSGVTTADTLLPHPEAILRDFLLGQEWLRANGMVPEPGVAYFPDSFGYTHALPSLLNAAGFDQAGITRVDGMLFPGCDWPIPSAFQWPGSTAALLMKKERTLDFVWRDGDGGEVLCHWNAHTYGQGDMLAYSGLSRVYLFPVAFLNRSAGHVARRINHFAQQLLPYSRTPYLFCPIGFDFIGPTPGLVSLLDRYNREHYPKTGIWAANAGIDDYLALVDCHRRRLPVLEIDPNPYWTGFYTSRPSLKKLCHELVDALLLAEGLALLPENVAASRSVAQELGPAWWNAVVANHHDFITGTSMDRVVQTEQVPWLKQGAEIAAAVTGRLGKTTAAAGGRPAVTSQELPQWRARDGTVEVHTPYYSLELAEEAGGCIVRAGDPAAGSPLLAGPSADLVAYADSGGLWRMGHEFSGGTLKEVDRASLHPVRLQVRELADSLEVSCTVQLEGTSFTRRWWFRGDRPAIDLQVQGHAAERRTVTLRFATGIEADHLAMDEAGGVIVRPIRKKYDPTFWPLQSFVHIQANEQERGVAIFLEMPGAVAGRPGGQLEVVTHRNATHEKAWGFVSFPGLPVTGHERLAHAATCRLLFTPGGDWRANQLPRAARQALGQSGGEPTPRARFGELAAACLEIDPPDVLVSAIKPAARGAGWIVRLSAPGRRGLPVVLALRPYPVVAAYLCDARERDLVELDLRGGAVHLTMPGSIATVRLVLPQIPLNVSTLEGSGGGAGRKGDGDPERAEPAHPGDAPALPGV